MRVGIHTPLVTTPCHITCLTREVKLRSFSAKPSQCNWRQSRRRSCRCQASKQLSLFSPSKINLFLRILRKRPDGYHDLASLFHVIDLGDDMDFEILPEGSRDELSCNMDEVPTDDSNLVLKALNLFREKTGSSQHMKVRLNKTVPLGAGLGGGSGNAATTLWAANELSSRPATESELLEWAGEIGSDISVFFSDGAAYCTGRGEIVENVEPPLPLDTPLLLVKPPFGCSTPAIFRALDLGKHCSQEDPLRLLSQLSEDHTKLASLCLNDLEEPAFQTQPELRSLKERIVAESNGAFSAIFMTGSGSTLVCIGNDKQPAFLSQSEKLFVRPARLIARRSGQWYQPSLTSKEPALL